MLAETRLRRTHAEGVDDELGLQIVTQRPAHAAVVQGVDHDGQDGPALLGGHVVMSATRSS